ncbi:hypothetical protein FGO68_gene9962 [Halteria grandinella]|uniref:Cytochrome P450 n=1 Tax=Halteria grandinella TaxID=5974 RepID=A0A8J8NR53_HALGN|nr:hypothetical protein FGO68_gene9962 [Halteria grandinella]
MQSFIDKMIFSFFFYLLLAYFVYDRFIRIYMRMHFYRKQGIPYHFNINLPIIGSVKSLKDFQKEHNPTNHPIIEWNKHHYFPNDSDTVPPITGLLLGSQLRLMVNRPEIVEEMLITQNKYYDKHPGSATNSDIVVGKSILFAQSDLQWQQKRKVISSALYKDRLRGMIETIKDVTIKAIESDWMLHKDQNGVSLEIVNIMQNLFMQVTLSCFFGQSIEVKPTVSQLVKGEHKEVRLGEAIQNSFEQVMGRPLQPLLIVFRELLPYFITQSDRELKQNALSLRAFIRNLINERRKLQDGQVQSGNVQYKDLLSILLNDPNFENDDSIVDECLTFFLAGSMTTASTTANTVCYLIQSNETEKKLRESLKQNFDYFADSSKTLQDLASEITLETLDLRNDEYLKYCFNESLRIEPPVPFSSSLCMTEEVTIGGFIFKKGEGFYHNCYQLHHNLDQWGPTHDEYIPERFDPGHVHEYPKRHPMSFLPFSGGKRVCVGKTFAEIAFKIVMPLVMKAFNKDGRIGEFADKEHYTKKPHINGLQLKRSKIIINFNA